MHIISIFCLVFDNMQDGEQLRIFAKPLMTVISIKFWHKDLIAHTGSRDSEYSIQHSFFFLMTFFLVIVLASKMKHTASWNPAHKDKEII